ncbi:flagellar hook-associated protein FlgK [Listeria ilorinensis]|uniref:flagellar hook-associated protein FlgK n=1 Tax=Listeria ilorinensis TaxID=2867439 RepID=UPI001EF71339|nr:flagellar hook-associated protein FlgK [Listeria ilorinensis]
MRLSDFNASLSGMSAAQIATMVAKQNISNLNTAGYVRQTVQQKELFGDSGMISGRQTGYGVKVTDISRVTNQVLTTQFDAQIAKQSAAAFKSSTLGQIVNLFGTVGKNSPSDSLDNFFTAWGVLTKNPDQETNVTALLSSMKVFTSQLGQIKAGLDDLKKTLTQDTANQVKGLNDLSSKLAAVNKAIGSAGSNPPNSLLNERDLLLGQLSQFGTIETTSHPGNPEVYDITFGGKLIVQGDQASQVDATLQGDTYIFSIDGQSFDLPTGSLKASSSVQEQELRQYTEQLAAFTKSLKENVDQLQVDKMNRYLTDIAAINDKLKADPLNEALLNERKGLLIEIDKFPKVVVKEDVVTIGGTDYQVDAIDSHVQVANVDTFSLSLFQVDTNGNLSLNSKIEEIGDNKRFLGVIAADMKAMKDQLKIDGMTYSSYMDNLITTIATDTSKANAEAVAEQNVLDGLTSAKSSLEGVNLDEEMTNILQYQSYYVANTKAVNVVNEMFKSLLGML